MTSSEIQHNHQYPIPRITLEFDPAKVGSQAEFNLKINKSDLDNAVLLDPPLKHIPEVESETPHGQVTGSALQNIGGKLAVAESDTALSVDFGFSPLPARAERPEDSNLSYFERFRATMLPLQEHLRGRASIFYSVANITNLQYQYAVRSGYHDDTGQCDIARFSYCYGNDIQEPRIVVPRAFDEAMQAITRQQSEQLTHDAATYLRYLDPTRLKDADDAEVLSFVSIPNYGRLFSSGDSSVGQRSRSLEAADTAELETERDYRLQAGDQYIAAGHNLDSVSNPQLLVMVALGSIQRLIREHRVRQ